MNKCLWSARHLLWNNEYISEQKRQKILILIPCVFRVLCKLLKVTMSKVIEFSIKIFILSNIENIQRNVENNTVPVHVRRMYS